MDDTILQNNFEFNGHFFSRNSIPEFEWDQTYRPSLEKFSWHIYNYKFFINIIFWNRYLDILVHCNSNRDDLNAFLISLNKIHKNIEKNIKIGKSDTSNFLSKENHLPLLK